MKRVLFVCWLLFILIVLPSSTGRAASVEPPETRISPWVIEHTRAGAQAEFLVVLADQADLSGAAAFHTKAEKGRFVRDALWNKAQATQGPLLSWLAANKIEHRSYYIVNLIWVKGNRDVALALAARPEVARLEGNPKISNFNLPSPDLRSTLFGPQFPNAVEPNIAYVRAPEVWAMGYTGQGIVIGGQDTGYQWDHPALKPHYRGWNGVTASHDYNWHDSIHSGGGSCGANSPVPCDDHSHGTHTMGTALGSDGGSNQIGMAPGARWIGCRNMDQGVGTPATYLECFEFFLAPYPVGGTPAQGDPSMAPDVTNNSWGCPTSEGCSPNTLLAAVQAQRAAGIMTVVSAGNDGPSCSTVQDPPAIYGEVYSVGALNTGTDTIASFSSRGPVTVDGSNRRKPDITAPGTTIRSSVPGGGYASAGWSGTSMAGPHVAGAVALLWSASPLLKNQIAATEQLLSESAVHIASSACGSTGWPNNTYGYGRLDVKAAVDMAVQGLLKGVVTDAATALPIVGAQVQLSRPGQNFATTSLAGGLYSLSVPSNTYTVTATSPGYMIYSASGVAVQANQTTTLDIALQVTPTFIISGSVRDVSTGEPLSATVSIEGWASTHTDPSDGEYTLLLNAPEGEYTLRAEAANYVAQSRGLHVTGSRREEFELAPVCLLVVDDDGGMNYQAYYTEALERSGQSYRVVTVGPELATLAWYQGVIWLTGNEAERTLTASDRAALGAYLDGGGRLFLSGQDIGMDIGATGFYRDYLHAAFRGDDTNVYTLSGMGFLSGLDVTIQGGSGANNQLHPSEIEPVGGGEAVYDYPAPYLYGGVAYSGTYRSVYFSFGYEAIDTVARREAVLSATLRYLGVCGAPEGPRAGFAVNRALVEIGEAVFFTNTTRGTAWMTYTWSFGDGSGSGAVHATHRYWEAGMYAVVLTASNRYGRSVYSQTVEVRAAPTARLMVEPAVLRVGVEVGELVTRALTISNVGGVDLTWNLVITPTVDWLMMAPASGVVAPMESAGAWLTFTAPVTAGVYTTTLSIASNDPATPQVEVAVTLTVECPVVSGVGIEYAPSAPRVGEVVVFSGTAQMKDAGVLSVPEVDYVWDFGDGGHGQGAVVTHTFPLTVTMRGYTVTLTVTNVCQNWATATREVMVHPYAVYLPVIVNESRTNNRVAGPVHSLIRFPFVD